MRRLVVVGLAALAAIGGSSRAAAQFYQQRSSAQAAAVPTFHRIEVSQPLDGGRRVFQAPQQTATPAQPTPAPVQPPASDNPPARDSGGDRDRDRDHDHHHHHRPGWSNRWNGWGGIGWWPAVVVPVWDPYAYAYPGFAQPGFGVTLPSVNSPAPQVAAPLSLPAPTPTRSKVRATSPEWKAKAGKFMTYGDTNFAKQNYLAAVERYKTAAQMAPDLAEPFFRQAFALVAQGQYESAAKAFRRGLKIRSDWSGSPLRLDQLYGADKLAKNAHLENLAKAVEANPLDSELLIALGMQLFFNGEAQRSEVFFARAAQLGANDDRLLDHFLPQPGPAGAGKPDNPTKQAGKVAF